MKRAVFFFWLLMQTFSMNAKVKVTRIDPTNWYVGMKDPSLQLMFYGEDLDGVEVTTDYLGARVDSVVHLPNAHYLLAYLNLRDAHPGVMTLRLTKGNATKKVLYELKQREMSGEKRMGFTNADVLYMLMPDRFANGNGKNDQVKGMNKYVCDRTNPSLRHGGDLEGIRQHLDYFNQLGVTALWFTPVLENNSPDTNGFSTYHGYATTDYYKVDPRFGTNEEYRKLIHEAHEKGLKVVMDMIFNHCGLEHPWMSEMPSPNWFNCPEWLRDGRDSGRDSKTGMANGAKTNSKYLQTSYKLTPVLDPYASKVDMRETVDGWFVPSMPDLNQRNPHVMKYLIQNSIWWIETAGIDGIRMDTYPYADRRAMAQWMKTIDTEYPNFNTVGETWVTEPAYTAAWQKNSKLSDVNSYLKTVMDFSFFDKLNKAKNEETDAWWSGYNRIYNSLVYDYLYPNPSSVMAFIENHDTDRFLGKGMDVPALKQALALLLTINRTPQLYYGTEVLMNGTKEVNDGYVREDFPGGFPGDTHNCFTSKGRTKAENDMFSWLSRLLHWRQANKVITKGNQTQFIPFHGVYVIARQYQGRTVLVALNGKRGDNVMSVKRYAEVIANHTTAKNILTGQQVDLTKDVPMADRAVMVLEF
ncbi:glycoside hydrolase family 13 protein [Hallella colorans]|uniref:glycoside hydrolase family 13 protein n=1 Tax=Hallella colorans TaxID=1703337 RepID=UPI0023F0781E|nr:glycoside hydrolase family 13 protein [Hallella colorans]